MSGVGIVRTLLAANAGLTAVVAAAKIMAGELPLKTAVPAIGITRISGVPYRLLKMGTSGNLWTERVQVTVEAASYPQVQSILALVRAALPATRGTVGSFSCDSIAPDIEGPDMFDADTGIHSGSQDFIVRHVR